MFNIGCLISLMIGLMITLVAWKKNVFRHRLERVFQYTMMVLLVNEILLVNLWRVSCLTANGDHSASDIYSEAFKGISDPYPDSDVIFYLTGCILYLAVVADMRFRRLVWICIIAFFVYAISVIYFKLPKIQSVFVPTKTQTTAGAADATKLKVDPTNGYFEESVVVESGDSLQNWLLALQLAGMYLISLFGKTQLELLQRQNFLELELAQKRIDVLEKTINAMDSKSQPHSHIEETHRRIKDAERIIEKLRLMNSGDAGIQELQTVLDVLRETEKTMTIMDFQKEVLIGPIKTGIEYKEEEVMNWLEKLVGGGNRGSEPRAEFASIPALIPISTIQGVAGDLDLGLSAKSLMKRLGLDWHLDPGELERTLKSNFASDMNAFCLTSRALLTPFLNNVLLGITPDILSGFSKAMSDAYLDVPFHRGDHAAMVCHHACVLMEITGVRKNLGGLDRFAVHLAALGHDVSHFGRTNSFLVDTKHELAMRYNDQSVLENFHASKTFDIIRSSKQTNILATLSKRDEKRLRNRVIQLILATDSEHHFTHQTELRMRLLGQTNIFEDSEMMDADRRIGMTSLIKAADLGFFAVSLDVHCDWMDRLAEEFAQQGDNEKNLGIAISPMCDRDTQDIPAMAVGMMRLLVIPIYDEIAKLGEIANPSSQDSRNTMKTITDSIASNKAHWEAKRRGPRSHLGSFDMFIPVPKDRTITTGSGDADPSSPPSLILVSSPQSVPPLLFNNKSSSPSLSLIEDDESEDDGPPLLPFNAVHRI